MKRSTERILVSHAGVLPRPADLQQLMQDGEESAAAFERRLPSAVEEAVRRQAGAGIDIVNDGELGKQGGFFADVAQRMTGIELRQLRPGETPRTPNIRDRRLFPGFYEAGLGRARQLAVGVAGGAERPWSCVGPLAYTGESAVGADTRRLKAAVQDLDVECFLSAVAPGTVEHWLWNEYYPDDESFLFAVADVLHREYQTITDAGITLQIDDPDLPDGWQIHPEMDVAAYRKFAELRIDALNHALTGIPEEQVRLHICWGSHHGPHKSDIPLRAIIDLVFKVRTSCYSIEGSNPSHEHEWQLWDDVKLPEGKLLMPGVVGHHSDLIEHPELVAQRLVRYADRVGRENIIASTDCGLASRVGHAEICWAKLESLAEGARIASNKLWARAA